MRSAIIGELRPQQAANRVVHQMRLSAPPYRTPLQMILQAVSLKVEPAKIPCGHEENPISLGDFAVLSVVIGSGADMTGLGMRNLSI